MDPFFISCVIGSDYGEKELTTEEGVVDTVHHEITNRKSEMQMTWGEYIARPGHGKWLLNGA